MTETPRVAFCPQCGNEAPQNVLYTHRYKTVWYGEKGTPNHDGPDCEAILCACATCREPLLYDGISRDEYGVWPSLAFPEKGEMHKSVPESVREVYSEAFRVKRTAPRAFALLIRKALEVVCDDKEVRRGNLSERLKALAASGAVPPTLAEITEVLRTLGNTAAHGPLERITVPMTWAIDEFFRAVVEYVYVAPSKLVALRESLARLDDATRTRTV